MKKVYHFNASPKFMMLSGALSLIVMLFFFAALFIVFNWIFKIILVAFVVFIFYKAHKIFIRQVVITDMDIEIIHIYGYREFFKFERIKYFDEYQIGFFPYNLIRVHLDENKKKIAFYCPTKEREEFNEFLKLNKHKVKPQP